MNWSELKTLVSQRVLMLENELSVLDEEKLNAKTQISIAFMEDEIIRSCDIESGFDFSNITNPENAVYIVTVKALELIFSDMYTGSGNSIYKEKSEKFGYIYGRDFKESVEKLIYTKDSVTEKLYLANTAYSTIIR